jgi:hypothetical protein
MQIKVFSKTVRCGALMRVLLVTALLVASALAQLRVIQNRSGEAPGGGTKVWSLVQSPINATCGNVTSCVVTLSSNTLSGSLLVAVFTSGSPPISITSASGAGTWTLCSGCASSDTTAGSSDIIYNLNSTSGVGSITLNFNTNCGACDVKIYEIAVTNGPAVLDTQGNRDQSTNATSIAGVTLTLTGTTDAILQGGIASGTFSGIDSSYTNSDFTNGNGRAILLNTASGTAPNWTSTSGRAALTAIAFK